MTSFGFRALRAASRGALAASLLASAVVPGALAQEPAQTAASVQTGVAAWSIPSSEVPPDPAIRFGRLENGMRYALMHHEMPKGTASMRFTIDVGAREEGDDEIGIAHFVEHMAFNGSENIPEGELVPKLERLGLAFGADTNAEVGAEHTTYKLDLPRTDDETVDTGLMVLREVASRLTLDAAAAEREKGVIQSEARVRNVPTRIRAADVLAKMLPANNIGRRISVTPEQIAGTSAESLRPFYEGYYRPERSTLVIVGDFDLDAMENKVRSTFADWRGKGKARVSHAPPVAQVSAPLIGAFSDPSIPEVIEIMRLSTYAPPENSAAEQRRELLLAVASMTLTNRLSTIALQPEAPILGGQAAYQDLFRSAESFGALVVAKDGEWRDALATIEQELRRAHEFGFTQAEIAEAKANLATLLSNAVEQKASRQSAAIAEQLAAASLSNDVPESPETQLAVYRAIEATVTPEAVHQAFREAWQGAPTGVHVSTKQAIADAPRTIAAALSESTRVAVTAPVEAEVGAFAYTDFGPTGDVVFDQRIEDLGIRTVRFANGVQLNLKRTDFEPGKIAFHMLVGEGQSAFPRDREGLLLMLDLVGQLDGLEAHNIDELRRILAGRSVSLGIAGGDNAIVAQGGTTAADLALQMQLLAAQITARGYRPETQAQWAATAGVLAQNLKANPMQIMGLGLNYTLAGNDPRMGLSDLEGLSSLTLDDLKAVIEPQLERGPIALGLVGDFDEQAAIAAVAETLGALPARAPRAGGHTARAAFADDRSTRVLRHSGAADQGVIAVSWPTTDDSDARSTAVRGLLSAVMQLRLLDELREKLGATYSPAAVSAASGAYAGFGHLTTLAFPAQPAQMDLIAQTMKSIAAALAASPPSDDEILRARGPVLEQIQRSERTNGGWTALVAEAQADPEELDRRRQRRATLQSIDAAELQAAARQWFSGEPMEIRVLPAE